MFMKKDIKKIVLYSLVTCVLLLSFFVFFRKGKSINVANGSGGQTDKEKDNQTSDKITSVVTDFSKENFYDVSIHEFSRDQLDDFHEFGVVVEFANNSLESELATDYYARRAHNPSFIAPSLSLNAKEDNTFEKIFGVNSDVQIPIMRQSADVLQSIINKYSIGGLYKEVFGLPAYGLLQGVIEKGNLLLGNFFGFPILASDYIRFHKEHDTIVVYSLFDGVYKPHFYLGFDNSISYNFACKVLFETILNETDYRSKMII